MTGHARPFRIQDYSDAHKQAIGPLAKFGISSPERKLTKEGLKEAIEDASYIIDHWDDPEKGADGLTVRERAFRDGFWHMDWVVESRDEMKAELAKMAVRVPQQ